MSPFLMMRLFWVMLIVGGICAPSLAQLKVLKSPAEVGGVPEVAEALKHLGHQSVDIASHPRFTLIFTELTELLNLAANDAEKAEQTYVVLARSGDMNACFLNLSEGVRLVVLNMGFFGFMEEDSESLGVIGHEFEHGWSPLETYLEDHENRSLVKRLKMRAIENEVDLRSVFYRVIPAGGDPYAFGRFLRRIRVHFGDGLSRNARRDPTPVWHTRSESRAESLFPTSENR